MLYYSNSTMQLVQNKKATHNYDILKKYEAGIQLQGWEVKSLRQKHGSLKEAYLKAKNQKGKTELFLHNAHIPLYQPQQGREEDPYRDRKILLHRKEIQTLEEALKQKGLTLIPLRIYLKGNLMKLEIALARGKKLHDKRADMKKRTAQREAERVMKRF